MYADEPVTTAPYPAVYHDPRLLPFEIQVRITPTEIPDLDSDRRLRTVEFARFLKVERDSLFSSNDPLWERVVGRD